jgi:hypothetical protein
MASMLTTEDNPYDPRSDFKAWDAWDRDQGYNTCDYLARVASVPDDFPQEIIDMFIDRAMDEIIELHAGGLYKKLPVEQAA